MNYEDAIKNLNDRFAKEKAKVEDRYDKEMADAKKQPTEAMRKAAERVAERHRDEALHNKLNGIETDRQKFLAMLLERQAKEKK